LSNLGRVSPPVVDRPAHRDALAGFTVGITADRRWHEQAQLLERRGARTIHAPVIRTLPLADPEPLRRATESLIARPPDLVAVVTAIGLRSWVGAAESLGLGEALVSTLARATIVTRGPKAAGAVVSLGLTSAWTAPEARTSELVGHLVEVAGGRNGRVALQLDGAEGEEPHSPLPALLAADVDVVPVPVYRWTRPDHPDRALRLVESVAEGTVDAVTFTAGPAVRNFVSMAAEIGQLERVLSAFSTGAVIPVCVGPVSAEQAASLGIERVVHPVHPRLGAMVQAAADRLRSRAREFAVGSVRVRLQGRFVTLNGDEPLELTDRERAVLEVLADRPGVVVSKARLARQVWGPVEGDEHLVEVTVARLRKRLGPLGQGIETVVRRGYRLGV
jgi:uroporphyrinogen-III synthase